MKIANKTDFLKNEAESISLDPVTSLPSLTTSNEGITKYMSQKLRVWEGTKWTSWVTPFWSDELEELSTVQSETDTLTVTSSKLDEDYNVAKTYGYSSNTGTLGIIDFIGADNSLDFNLVAGNLVSVTAYDGCWFHVQNLAGTPPANHKQVKTKTGNDVHYLKKALFVYNALLGQFVLIDYSRHDWHDTTSIGPTGFLSAGTSTFDIAVPYNGVYNVSIFLEVEEYKDDQVTVINTISEQTLSLGTPNGVSVVDISGHMNVSDTAAGWYNHSLQGSAVIDVSGGSVRYTVNLPNGSFHKILSGYADIQFLKE